MFGSLTVYFRIPSFGPTFAVTYSSSSSPIVRILSCSEISVSVSAPVLVFTFYAALLVVDGLTLKNN